MKVTMIHGQSHKGSTYHVARMIAERICGNDNIEEFFLPDHCKEGCLGCFACVLKGMESCPHFDETGKILHSMLDSDVIVIGSPTYVLEMTGHLKNLFDQLFCAWMSHRPEKAMFSKTAIAISTAAGSGMNGVTKSIARQLFYMGVPKVYRFPVRVAAMSWDDVKAKDQISAKADRIARSIIRRNGKAKPGIKLRFMFTVMRQMQKKNDWTLVDKTHWENNGWLGKERPWK